jgi:hypothetical protein
MKKTLTIIRPYSIDLEVKIEPSAYCPNENAYFIGNDLLTHVKTIYQAEKERSEWIRKYENALQGLRYWKEKAIEAAS